MAEEMKISVDENDPKLTEIVEKETAAIDDIEESYNNAVDDVDDFVNSQTEAIKNNAQTQIENQNAATDLAIEKIDQEKNEAEKSYQREQAGAYVDWQKQSNEYGVSAEQMAATGMTRTGYSESSKVAMYNQYQNRVAIAREVFNKAVLSYDNAIKEAKLQNSSALAEIAASAFEQQIAIAFQGFQYKNALLSERVDKTLQTKQAYGNMYQNVYDRLIKEAELNENARQFERGLEFTAEQNELDRAAELEQTKQMYPELNLKSSENKTSSSNEESDDEESDNKVTDVDFRFVTEKIGADFSVEQVLHLCSKGLIKEVKDGNTLSFTYPSAYINDKEKWKADVETALKEYAIINGENKEND